MRVALSLSLSLSLSLVDLLVDRLVDCAHNNADMCTSLAGGDCLSSARAEDQAPDWRFGRGIASTRIEL